MSREKCSQDLDYDYDMSNSLHFMGPPQEAAQLEVIALKFSAFRVLLDEWQWSSETFVPFTQFHIKANWGRRAIGGRGPLPANLGMMLTIAKLHMYSSENLQGPAPEPAQFITYETRPMITLGPPVFSCGGTL